MWIAIKYHFRLFSQAIEFYLAQVFGDYTNNLTQNFDYIFSDGVPTVVQFRVYKRNGYIYLVMDEPILDIEERIK